MAEVDAELVQSVLEGETGSFRALVERYQDAVFGVALSRTGSFADAEDIAQETFLAAFESLHQLAEPGSFGAWLYRIAVNTASKRIQRDRRREKRHASLPSPAQAGMPPDEVVERDETRGEVLAAVRRLPEASREAATLYYIDGYSTSDISGFTGRPVGTIRRRLHDARKQLRKELVTMVEDQLKKSRPGKQFTDRVLREITRVRVWIRDTQSETLLLTDSQKRSYPIIIGTAEGRSIEPWLAGSGSSEALDLHTALVRALEAFACRIADVVVSELKGCTFHALLKLGHDGRTSEVDCRPSDGINLAVRAGAPILMHREVAERCVMSGPHGTPLSPAKAWRVTKGQEPLGNTRGFRDISAVLRALRKNPESPSVRSALAEATGGLRRMPPRVLDVTGGMEQLRAWAEKCKEPELQGIVEGVIGAMYLIPRAPSDLAIESLEEAHKHRPTDKRIAFDLATAYAQTGRADDAFAMLEKADAGMARQCGNFRRLWRDPRFRAMVGKPERGSRDMFYLAQFPIMIQLRPPAKLESPKLPAKVAPLRPMGQRSVRRLERRLEWGPLVRIEGVLLPFADAKNKSWLVLEVEGRRAAALRLNGPELSLILRASPGSRPQRPMTPQTARNLLRATGIKLEAAVLTKRSRSGIEGSLAVSRDGRQEAVPIAGAAAVAVALTAKRPILITESLAEKLYVRGKSGRPLTPRGAKTKLTAS